MPSLKNLEQEVDLIKTSIKRLLMDIRERVNEIENPHTLASFGSDRVTPDGVSALDEDIREAQQSALKAREAALDDKESQMDATKAKLDAETRNESPKKQHEPETPSVNEDENILDDRMFALLKSQIADSHKSGSLSHLHTNEKLKSIRYTIFSDGPTRRSGNSATTGLKLCSNPTRLWGTYPKHPLMKSGGYPV